MPAEGRKRKQTPDAGFGIDGLTVEIQTPGDLPSPPAQ